MQFLPNRFENTLDVFEYLIVPEPQHEKSRLLQKQSTCSIGLDVFRMLTAIQLDNESPFQANEIQDVVSERVLAPELAIAKLPSAKTTPEQALGFSRRSAQPSLQSRPEDGAVGLGFHSVDRPQVRLVARNPSPPKPSP